MPDRLDEVCSETRYFGTIPRHDEAMPPSKIEHWVCPFPNPVKNDLSYRVRLCSGGPFQGYSDEVQKEEVVQSWSYGNPSADECSYRNGNNDQING